MCKFEKYCQSAETDNEGKCTVHELSCNDYYNERALIRKDSNQPRLGSRQHTLT